MKKTLAMILLLYLTFGGAFCENRAARDLLVEIFPAKNAVQKGEIFTIITRITNVTAQDQKICFWSCSYDENWRLDDSLKKIDFYLALCEKNIVSCVSLTPFEAFDKELHFQVSEEASTGNCAFRLGFMPCINREECFETAKDQEIFWSQQAAVVIK